MIGDFLIFSMANEAGMEGIPVRKLICDRCGKEIDQGYNDDYNLHPKAFCRIFGHHYPSLAEESGDLEYDLCEDCANQLVTFLKNSYNLSPEDWKNS